MYEGATEFIILIEVATSDDDDDDNLTTFNYLMIDGRNEAVNMTEYCYNASLPRKDGKIISMIQ